MQEYIFEPAHQHKEFGGDDFANGGWSYKRNFCGEQVLAGILPANYGYPMFPLRLEKTFPSSQAKWEIRVAVDNFGRLWFREDEYGSLISPSLAACKMRLSEHGIPLEQLEKFIQEGQMHVQEKISAHKEQK